ncbi:MAG: TIM barrel protein [Bradyrhizobiaceae bacterium]|nr:TIM barrel protein [Bradyrhizobiaceae bacterium]
MPRFAANLGYLFTDRPLAERPAAAARAGFAAIELQFPYDVSASAMKAQIEAHDLTMLGINTALGRRGDVGLAAVPGRERDFAMLFQQALEYVVAIGGTAIHCMAGVVPPEQRPAADKVFVANLTRAADLASEKSIRLLIEPLNPRDRPNYFLTRLEHAADIIGRVGRDNVKVQFDFYHAQIAGGDLIKRFEALFPVVGHVQIAAVPSRAEPDEGEVNYHAIFAMLDRIGYAGWIGCEYRPRGKTEDGLGWASPYGLRSRTH